MVIWLVRLIFLLLVIAVLLLGFSDGGVFDFKAVTGSVALYQWMAVLTCVSILVLGLSVDLLIPHKSLAGLAGMFFGLIAGLLIGQALNYVIEMLYTTYGWDEHKGTNLYLMKDGIKGLINIICCYWAIVFVVQTKDDFRFIIPYVEFSRQTKSNTPLLLDTSVIIDGRIADIAATRIFDSPMIIPRFILAELQCVADSADRLRRNRGRRGLDILNKMQINDKIDLSICDIDLTKKEQSETVDHQLVSAAQKLKGKVVTNDYNLNKVAQLRGVEVININDLAGALKAVVLPGEAFNIRIVKPGDQADQGVGYLDDGTMVVVEDARRRIGQEITVTVTSVLQTSAGRMIFGKP